MSFILTKYINSRDFCASIVYGEQRAGKTVFAMKTAYQIYGDWDLVFENLFFDLGDLVNAIKSNIGKPKKKLVIFDDAGVSANSLTYFIDKEGTMQMKQMMDLIGTSYSCVLFTTPTPMGLLKSIKSYPFLRTKITMVNDTLRNARTYSSNLLPSGKMINHTLCDDSYSKMLPQEIYNKYQPLREKMAQIQIEKMDKFVAKKKQKQLEEEME